MLNVTHKTKASYDYIKIPVFVYQIGCNVRKRQNTVSARVWGNRHSDTWLGRGGGRKCPNSNHPNRKQVGNIHLDFESHIL